MTPPSITPSALRASLRREFIPFALAVLSALMLSTLPACAARRAGPYQPAAETARNTTRAEELTRRAASLIDSKPQQAESLLREALAADLYHGPAHNNLGVLYLAQNKLYEAAGEFEWARRLMPGHPDPRVNLAMTLERAGRTDEAIESYSSALDVVPEHLPAMQGLARLQLRARKADDRTPRLLADIALRGDPEWSRWAKVELARSKTDQ